MQNPFDLLPRLPAIAVTVLVWAGFRAVDPCGQRGQFDP